MSENTLPAVVDEFEATFDFDRAEMETDSARFANLRRRARGAGLELSEDIIRMMGGIALDPKNCLSRNLRAQRLAVAAGSETLKYSMSMQSEVHVDREDLLAICKVAGRVFQPTEAQMLAFAKECRSLFLDHA